jgi:hypothetical protein
MKADRYEHRYNFARLVNGHDQLAVLSVAQQLGALSATATLTPRLLDLLDVAVAVYTVDRLSKRYGHTSRRFDLTLPVREPEAWNDSETKSALEQTLKVLTEDQWTLTFVRARSPAAAATMLSAYPPEQTFRAALFSGGLDSVAGAMNRAFETPGAGDKLLLVAGSTSTRLRAKQLAAVEAMNHAVKIRTGVAERFVPAFFKFDLSQDDLGEWYVDSKLQEISQRTRGFIFPVLGAVAASALGTQNLLVFENGVGAINLPLVTASLGVDQSRAMHPLHLSNLERFLARLLGHAIRFENPNAFRTKGEMCQDLVAELGHDAALEVVAASVSCDSFGMRHDHPSEHCGRCTSCLLRRAATLSAQLREDSSFYLHDLAELQRGQPSDGTQGFALMRMFATRLDKGARRGGMRGLLGEFPELRWARDGLRAQRPEYTVETIDERLEAMFVRYKAEWNALDAALSKRESLRAEVLATP